MTRAELGDEDVLRDAVCVLHPDVDVFSVVRADIGDEDVLRGAVCFLHDAVRHGGGVVQQIEQVEEAPNQARKLEPAGRRSAATRSSGPSTATDSMNALMNPPTPTLDGGGERSGDLTRPDRDHQTARSRSPPAAHLPQQPGRGILGAERQKGARSANHAP